MRLIIALSLIGNICYAEDSVYLTKNQSAPFEGFLIPKEKVQELRNAELERNTYKAVNDSLKVSLDLEQKNSTLKDQKISLLLDQNDKLAKTAYQDHSLNNWEKVGIFAAGVVLTGLAVKAAHEIYK